MLENLQDIIEHDPEHTGLDFKAIQFRKEKHFDFLKDIMAMANAKIDGKRHIITGVKCKDNGVKEFKSIDEGFIDDAIYQQLVNENIEPEIKFKYFPITIEGNTLGVFEIFACDDPPYMMKKDFKSLKKGDSYIRIGTHNSRLTRKDIDFFIDKIKFKDDFNGVIEIYFGNDREKELTIKPIKDFMPPSDRAAERIREVIKSKQNQKGKLAGNINALYDIDFWTMGGTSYENRSIKTLKENLENVRTTYAKNDLYYFFETISNKLNIKILNSSEEYLEDAYIEITISKKFILVAKEIFRKPERQRSMFTQIQTPYVPEGPSWEILNYPNVNETKNDYIITENIQDLRHQIEKEIFKVPLRVVPLPNIKKGTVLLKIRLHAKNLRKPLKRELRLIIKK